MDQNWNSTGDEGGGLLPAFPVLLNRFSSSVVWSCDQIRVAVTSDSSASKNQNILTADVSTSVSLPSFIEACFCPKIPDYLLICQRGFFYPRPSQFSPQSIYRRFM